GGWRGPERGRSSGRGRSPGRERVARSGGGGIVHRPTGRRDGRGSRSGVGRRLAARAGSPAGRSPVLGRPLKAPGADPPCLGRWAAPAVAGERDAMLDCSRQENRMRPSAVSWLTVLAGCGLLGACATGGAPPAAAGAFALAPAVREVAAASAPAAAERPLRAYARTIHTAGTGPAGGSDVGGRQARMPDGTLASVTGSQAAGVFGMSRALGLCGLVALRL